MIVDMSSAMLSYFFMFFASLYFFSYGFFWYAKHKAVKNRPQE